MPGLSDFVAAHSPQRWSLSMTTSAPPGRSTRIEVHSAWLFEDRAALDAVLHLEFPAALATSWLQDHPERCG
jgi:hypothetical protein